jgi:hypothetical protein
MCDRLFGRREMIHNLAVDESCVELPLAEYYTYRKEIGTERKRRDRDEMRWVAAYIIPLLGHDRDNIMLQYQIMCNV